MSQDKSCRKKSNKRSNPNDELLVRKKRVESQQLYDKEIHELLKKEILLKIENEKELLKCRKMKTQLAEYDLLCRKEKHSVEMEFLLKNKE